MFKLAARPFLMPGRTLTGQSVGPVVDTEAVLINGGRVYLSETEVAECVRHMPQVAERLAGELGWVAPVVADQMRAEIQDLRASLTEAQAAVPMVVSLDDARALLAATAA